MSPTSFSNSVAQMRQHPRPNFCGCCRSYCDYTVFEDIEENKKNLVLEAAYEWMCPSCHGHYNLGILNCDTCGDEIKDEPFWQDETTTECYCTKKCFLEVHNKDELEEAE